MSTKNPNTFYFGPLIITGSTLQSADTSSATQYSGDFTGSLQGTSSFAVSASWAPSAGGGGGTTPTYFAYNAGQLSWTTAYQTITIPTSAITVDSSKRFKVDFWGSLYYPSDFFGELMDNQSPVYGQPVMLWSEDWSGTKVTYNFGTTNKNNLQARITYSGTGNQLQVQYKAGSSLNGIQLDIYGTVTYLQ